MYKFRCLEEGAEEFFLKPVQLSDVKRLKPYLLKGKSRQQQLYQQQQQQSGKNKRKAIEEVLSPEITRPIFSGLTVV